MVVYNVTVKVQQAIADHWLAWMKEEHIPDVTGTGCFTHATILRLLEVDDTEGPTYAVQYHGADTGLYNKYITEFADEMRKRATEKWGDKFIAFRTVMQIVH
ncbi:MAG: DUF4286 family protein [Chitinophagaceae bacterium]|nr:DUF4286 family protein [Chitinophagaceae bacterium]